MTVCYFTPDVRDGPNPPSQMRRQEKTRISHLLRLSLPNHRKVSQSLRRRRLRYQVRRLPPLPVRPHRRSASSRYRRKKIWIFHPLQFPLSSLLNRRKARRSLRWRRLRYQVRRLPLLPARPHRRPASRWHPIRRRPRQFPFPLPWENVWDAGKPSDGSLIKPPSLSSEARRSFGICLNRIMRTAHQRAMENTTTLFSRAMPLCLSANSFPAVLAKHGAMALHGQAISSLWIIPR